MAVSKGVLLGLGNPLLDLSTTCDKEFLDKYGLKANDAILAEDKHHVMYDELVEKYDVEYIAGGATQNSIRVAQWLLGTPEATSMFGCVGKDKYADKMREKAEEVGVHVNYLVTTEQPTGTCAVLLTDHNRSLCAYLAAANCYKKDHLVEPENWAVVEQAKVYYSGGFHLTVAPDAMLALAKHAAEKDKIFCLNLSAPFLCEFFCDPMMNLMPCVDILFGNETECVAFAKKHEFGTEDIKEIAKKIAELPKENKKRPRTVIITQGKDPIITVTDGKVTEYPIQALGKDEIVDTNGAGDAFVGGYLSQLVQDKDEAECVRCGNYAANYIIKQSGVTLNDKPDFK